MDLKIQSKRELDWWIGIDVIRTCATGGKQVTMIKCLVCSKKSPSGNKHRCIVCDNEYDSVEATSKHCVDRGHPGGHHPPGGVLARAREQLGKKRPTVRVVERGTEDDEEELGLNNDAAEILALVDEDDAAVDAEGPLLNNKRKTHTHVDGECSH